MRSRLICSAGSVRGFYEVMIFFSYGMWCKTLSDVKTKCNRVNEVESIKKIVTPKKTLTEALKKSKGSNKKD